MVCRDAPNFERFIRERIPPRSEAGKMVAALAKDTSLSNAVALAIEALPVRANRPLRQLLDQFEDFCEWVDVWEPKGWKLDASTSGWVEVRPPKDFEWGGPRRLRPRDEVIAVAAGAPAVHHSDVDFEPEIVITFRTAK